MKNLIFAFLLICLVPIESYGASNKEDYDLQKMCAKDAKERFEKEYKDALSVAWFYPPGGSPEEYVNEFEKGGALVGIEPISLVFEYRNHYKRKTNKCFMHVWARALTILESCAGCEGKYNLTGGAEEYLLDVNEKQIYGRIKIARTIVFGKMTLCYLLEKKCESSSEWNALVKPYMED